MSATVSAAEQSRLAQQFETLHEQWKNETAGLPSAAAKVDHPSYQAIIALGTPAVPLLLRELEREPAWFDALKAITGEDPVPGDHSGNIAAMKADWQSWGRRRGFDIPAYDTVDVAVMTRTRPRLWPALVIVALMWVLIKVPGWMAPATMVQFLGAFYGPIIGMLAILVWWMFASRIRWLHRTIGLFTFVVAAVVALPLLPGDIGFGIFVIVLYALPIALTAWVVWLLVAAWLSWRVRFLGLLALFFLSFGAFALLRFDGLTGSFGANFDFRWNKTAEDKFLAELKQEGIDNVDIMAPDAAPLTLHAGDWPAFRGPDRDSRLAGVRISTDWNKNPPEKVWRHRVGPGWGSFAVVGERVFTQEQRGKREVVVCYDAETGKHVWVYGDDDRFTEPMAGPGPRATPTFHEGKLYTQGAAGQLNCFNAATGEVLWSHNIREDSGADKPMWGFSASPLVTHGLVIVFAGAKDKCLLAYDAASGELAWSSGEGRFSYCSPQLAWIGGVEQVLFNSDAGLTSFEPTTGTVLWQHDWKLQEGMNRVVQPAVLDKDDLLLGTSFGFGTRRLHVSRDGDDWDTKTVWHSRSFNPYYNDLVVHKDHAYGFDNKYLVCVRLEDGKEKWRVDDYNNGQVLLLPDQDLLLVLSESGEAALVEAVPDKHHELGKFQAIKGKTWNHPVIAGGKLFVRNGEEAACYKLTETGK